MNRFILALAVAASLSACGDGTNPFDEPLDENDPSTLNNKFLFDLDEKLTMNRVDYDEVNDQLVINNLPFDGPDGIYDRDGTQDGVGIYKSRKTGTTGQIQHYAVFMKNEDMEVAAAAGVEWTDFGYGGANVKRNSFSLPGGVGEYVYLGTYGGVRTREDGGGLDIVTGDVRLLLDIRDFDENGDGTSDGVLEGAIAGVVYDRNRTDSETGIVKTAQLPNISLAVVQYDPATGTFTDGEVISGFNDSIRDEGTWGGLIAGDTIGAHLVMEGTAEAQIVRYQVATYTDPVSGDEVSIYGYTNEDDYETVFDIVNSGQDVGLLEADLSSVPSGVSVTIEIEETVIETTTDAREVGVLLTEEQPTN